MDPILTPIVGILGAAGMPGALALALLGMAIYIHRDLKAQRIQCADELKELKAVCAAQYNELQTALRRIDTLETRLELKSAHNG